MSQKINCFNAKHLAYSFYVKTKILIDLHICISVPLNKEVFLRILLDYQGKFSNILDELKNDLNELKTKFCKLESDLHISRNVNDKLSDKLVVLECKCHANEQYSRRECLEISGIPAEVGDKDIEKKVLEVLDAIGAPVNTDSVEDCHRIPSKGYLKKVILKLSHWKGSRQVWLNKKKLKQLKPKSLNLPASVKIYINESLCPYYKKLWTKCKKLWDAKRILSFWVSNGSIRVKLVNENVSIITHDCDLEKLFPGDPLIADTN